MDEVNFVDEYERDFDPYEPYKILAMKVKPRQIKKLRERNRPKTPWDFWKSVFAKYQPDNKAKLERCFELDWSYIVEKVEYLIKNESDRAKTRAYLKKHYKALRDAFKLAAGQSTQGASAMSVNRDRFKTLLQGCDGLVDDVSLK